MTVYVVSNTNSDLTGGADFSKALVKSGPTTGSVTFSIAIGATETSYAFTPAGEPGATTIVGGLFQFGFSITTGNSSGRLIVSFSRINSAGVVQATTANSGEFTTSAGNFVGSVSSAGLGTFAAGDRVRMNFAFRNASTMTSISLTLALGTSATTYALVPWPVSFYWVGGTGTWDTSSTRWAFTSGGTAGAGVAGPAAVDDCIFDANSDAGTGFTVTPSGGTCGTCTFSTDQVLTLAGASNLSVARSIVFPTTNFVNSWTGTLNANGIGVELTTNGVTLATLNCVTTASFGWVLKDDLTTTGAITSVSFNAATFNVTCASFTSASGLTRTVSLGSGTWTLTGTGTVWSLPATGLTFSKGTANIVLSNNTTATRTFTGGGLTYNKLTIGGDTSTSTTAFTGSNTFSELASTKTVAHTVQFAAGTTTTVSAWTINGSAGNVVNLRSSVAGTRFTLNLL